MVAQLAGFSTLLDGDVWVQVPAGGLASRLRMSLWTIEGGSVCQLCTKWCYGDGLSSRTIAFARTRYFIGGQGAFMVTHKGVATLDALPHPFDYQKN